jgi:hypothetical protein
MRFKAAGVVREPDALTRDLYHTVKQCGSFIRIDNAIARRKDEGWGDGEG